MRAALAVVAAGLGCVSLAFSAAQLAVAKDPALAYRLAPYDGRITGAYATTLAGPDATPQDRARADALSRQALRQDPMAVAAAATLGMNASFRNDAAAARRYFAYAQKLSRRDVRTQLFMIEDAVQREDIPGALHQYDITLRVFPTLSDVLYPVLASASATPVIRQELVKTLAGKPAWAESFVNFVAGNSTDPRSTATLFVGLDRVGVAIPETARAGALNALISAGQTDQAWAYYRSIRPGADRRRSRDPRFAATLETPTPFDWTPVNAGGLSTTIQGGIFDFAAPASFGGPMLQQAQLLPPGTYRLTGHSIGIEQVPGALPYWTLRCQNGVELGRVEVPASGVAGGNFTGLFTVPAGCPLQTLILTARPSDAVSGLSGQFDRVELISAR